MCLSLTLPQQGLNTKSTTCTVDCNHVSSSKNDTTFMDKRLAQHISLLHNVIRSRRWSAFESIVLSDTKIFRMIDCAYSKEFDGTLLHTCLRHGAPLSITTKMIKMFSNRIVALDAKDSMGRTPLHIAAACSVDAMIVKLLGSIHPTTCSSLDKDGRTPLHLACDTSSCDSSCDTQEQDTQKSRQPSYGAIRALLSISLKPALIEDDDGVSALEYAILSDASMEVVELLQKATTAQSLLQEKQERSTGKKRRLSIVEGNGQENDKESCRRMQRRRVSVLSV